MADTTYTIEKSKSNRAKCKTCKEIIAKDDLRMTLTVPANPDSAKSYDMASHHHVDCFKLPRKLKHVTITEFVEDYVEVSADVEIPHDEIVKRLEAAAASGGKKKVKREHDENENGAGDLSLMERVVSAADSGDFQAPTKSPATKKVKQEKGRESSSNDDEFARMVQVYKTMPESSMGGLKDELRWNKQVLMGKREFVLFKVIDGRVNGRLGTCPLDQGSLKFNEGDYETVHCRGRFDESTKISLPCGFTGKRTDPSLRVHPWYTSEPTQEQKDEISKQLDEAKGKTASVGPEAKALMDAVAACKWDLGSAKGLQQATKELVKLVQDKLDLPERDAARELGPIVARLKDKSATEIMEEVVGKYGFKNVKEEKKDATIAALENSCENPKNAALVLAMSELSTLYYKGGDAMKGTAFKKIAAAIQKIPDEVTAENAISFSKGKTKVPGIGKSSAEKMKEFVETGTMEKLEELRAVHGN